MVNLRFCVLRHLVRLLVLSPHSFQLLIPRQLGSEIYVGCSNGDLIRFALQADDPNKVNIVRLLTTNNPLNLPFSQLESYTILSRQTLPGDKPIDEIVLIPSLLRALVLSGFFSIICLSGHDLSYSCSTDHQIHFFTIPSLTPFPIKPIRHVVTFAVDDQHLKRPPPSLSSQGVRPTVESVDFCVVKRAALAMYSLRDRLSYLKVKFVVRLWSCSFI